MSNATSTASKTAKSTTKAPKAAAPKAPKTSKPATPAPAPKESAMKNEQDTKSVATAAAKAPSDLHKNFQEWLEANGFENVDLETVKMVCALRHTFQRSEANQQHLGNRRNEAEAKKIAQAQKAKERAEKAMAKAKDLEKKLAKAGK